MKAGFPDASASVASPAAIRREMDLCVYERTRKILPVLFAGFLIVWTRSLLQSNLPVDWSSAVVGLIILGFWMLLRAGRIPLAHIQTGACALALLILLHSLAEFDRTADTRQIIPVLLLILGSANVFLDWRQFTSLLTASIAAWSFIAPGRLPVAGVVCWSVALLVAAGVSAVGVRLRISAYAQVHENRLTTEARQVDAEVNRERLASALSGTGDALWYWDLKSGIFHHSQSWASMAGFEETELEATADAWLERVHPGYATRLRREIAAVLDGNEDSLQNTYRLHCRDGSFIWVLTRAKPVRDDSGDIVGLAGSHAEVTSLIEAEKRLLNDSFQDKLTTLPNRDFLISCLERKMEEQRKDRNRAGRFAVMFLDLDRFKVVNDSLGHQVGDELLAAVAGRLRNCARPDDVVARFGGDEFVILLNAVRDEEEAIQIGSRMHNALSAPFNICGRDVSSGASIGIVMSSPDIDNVVDLLRFADVAMYRAKSNGKGRVQIFNEGMRSYATKLCDLQNDLRGALARGQFMLHYQPTFSIASGRIVGVEALMRWQRSPDELVMPNDFIPLAEEIGLIPEIGEWALRTACAQNAVWQKQGLPCLGMAVNVSARQLEERDFPESLVRILDETRLDRRWLELELTETALMNSLDKAPGALERLQKLGIRMAVDDFGTGYSSLNYLRQFPFQSLKMDRCFVSDVTTNGKTAAVAKGLIALAHNLDLSVIAEGIENDAQLSFLATHNCDHGQGFLASRPLPPELLMPLLGSSHVQTRSQYEPQSTFDLNRLGWSVGGQELSLNRQAQSSETLAGGFGQIGDRA